MPEDLIETVRREIRERVRAREERLRTAQDEQRIELRCAHGGEANRCVACVDAFLGAPLDDPTQ